jgi:phosphoribosyl 1,2-cyclic phosphodiesterase
LLVLRSLASGSSGNAFLLRSDRCTLLFDAGISLTKLSAGLHAEGITPGDIRAVLVSHEHWDHCAAAADLADKYRLPVYATLEVLRAAGLRELPQAEILTIGRPTTFGDVEVMCFPVPHDSVRPVGFLVRVDGRVVVIATDLGEKTAEVAEAVSLADLVVLEANHDAEMLRRGRYPYHLRQRVSGPLGHLSNSQAAAILVDHVKSEDVDIWLAHLSKENNSPTLAARTVRSALNAAGLGTLSLGIALRDKPSLRWNGVPRPKQLSLFPAAPIGVP